MKLVYICLENKSDDSDSDDDYDGGVRAASVAIGLWLNLFLAWCDSMVYIV